MWPQIMLPQASLLSNPEWTWNCPQPLASRPLLRPFKPASCQKRNWTEQWDGCSRQSFGLACSSIPTWMKIALRLKSATMTMPSWLGRWLTSPSFFSKTRRMSYHSIRPESRLWRSLAPTARKSGWAATAGFPPITFPLSTGFKKGPATILRLCSPKAAGFRNLTRLRI